MDREIYSLKVYSTRMEYDSFQLELTPKENEEANDYYGMNYNVTVWCRGQMCAKLWGKLYDENLVYSCGMDILNAADPFGREEVALAEAFNKSQELCVREEIWQNIQGFSGYIQGLFVMPQYRRRGIASYLLTHLDKILRHAMNIRIRAVGISPKLVAELDGDVVEDMVLLAANRALLEKCGYHEIMDLSLSGMMYGDYEEETSGTGYYVRVYPV
ncbi:MAG: GNAT family N-acetyltransferase [Lachnospiraceae bacterium]|nr:GNAT family N-acetyltransferase [Lachnospiraceae bacterium]